MKIVRNFNRMWKGDKPVWVYRNLLPQYRDKVVYSVMQGRRVLFHVTQIMLGQADFVVRESGRLRVLKTGRKNVHAFVRGKVVDTKGCFGTDEQGLLPAQIRYNPKRDKFFTWEGHRVKSAGVVILNEKGVTGAYLETSYGLTD